MYLAVKDIMKKMTDASMKLKHETHSWLGSVRFISSAYEPFVHKLHDELRCVPE
jgi:hypothetical protein